MFYKDKEINRVIEESVPGKQITLSHLIASPINEVFQNLNIEPRGAMGIINITPPEAAIIAADIAGKTANVEISYLDRCSGAVIILGDTESVEVALTNVNDILINILHFEANPVTRT